MFKRFLRDNEGATAIEYGLIAAMLCVTVIAAFGALKVQYVDMYGEIQTAVTDANTK